MVIAIDYDGTIADTNRQKVAWIATHLGRHLEPWQCDRTSCRPLIGPDAYHALADTVYERAGTLAAGAVPGAGAAIRELARDHRLVVLTARLEHRVAFAREWLERQGLLACFADVLTSRGTTKEAVCAAIAADVLIDDDLRHLHDLQDSRLVRILLQAGRPDRPEVGPGVHACRDWPEVVTCLRACLPPSPTP